MVALAIIVIILSAIYNFILAIPGILFWLGILVILLFIIYGIIVAIESIARACRWVKELLEL